MKKEYYVYISFYRGIPVYIGKGKSDRYQHTLHGQSGNEMINEFYFRRKLLRDFPLDTFIVKRFSKEQEALKSEAWWINRYKPYCNKCAGREHKVNNIFLDKLKEVCVLEGYDAPENLESKFDFRFLFTPFGLLCPYVNLSENSPFEVSRGYHVRIKSALHKHFPEYFLQFMDYPFPITRRLFNAIHTKGYLLTHLEENIDDMFHNLEVNSEWKLKAIYGGSLDFAEDFGYKWHDFNEGKFAYHNSLREQHILDYKSHLTLVEKKKMQSERQKAKKAELKDALVEASVNNTVVKIPESKVRVKATKPVLTRLEDCGFVLNGTGEWVNLSTDGKPYRIGTSIKKFKLISEEEFLGVDLSKFNKF